MTDGKDQDVIKIIYNDKFLCRPENRHQRDELIKKIHNNQLENSEPEHQTLTDLSSTTS